MLWSKSIKSGLTRAAGIIAVSSYLGYCRDIARIDRWLAAGSRVVQTAARAIPDARLVVLEDGGHLLLGRHREAGQEVAAFLD